MQIFLLYLFLFIVGCILGWFIEVLFRRLVSAKRWVNPGFMKGPWLPLYGFGVIVMFTMCFLCISFFPKSMHFYNPLGGLFERNYQSGPSWLDLIPIALMWLGMNLLEFVAGLIFIKGFHVKLWDYSNMKGNILGIVCPVFSLIWLFVAVLFYYGINPFLYVLSTNVHNYMFGDNGVGAHFGFIFALGLAYGLMIYDFVTSLGIFTAISRFAKEKGILERYESAKKKWDDNVKAMKKKLHIEEISQNKKEESLIKEKISEVIYINPEKEKNKKSNYDENGRPIKVDEDK